MNLANERLKTVFSYSDYDFGSVTDARGLSTILIVCTQAWIHYIHIAKYLY